MKYITIFISLCLALLGGTDRYFINISFAENDVEVIGTESPKYEEDKPVTMDITQEMIDQEEQLLEQKIREINETPMEEFGSLVQKRKIRSYYSHRLVLLRDSPESYFKTKTDK